MIWIIFDSENGKAHLFTPISHGVDAGRLWTLRYRQYQRYCQPRRRPRCLVCPGKRGSRQKAHNGIGIEEQTLIGRHESLDRYAAELKRQARGRGIVKLRRLLDLKRTYPPAPFQKAVEEALRYGLYDLARLEKMILKNTGGEFFEL